jgi:hypothetical protein
MEVGFRVWGFAFQATTPQAGCRVQGSEVQGSAFKVKSFRSFKVRGLWVGRFKGFEFRVQK